MSNERVYVDYVQPSIHVDIKCDADGNAIPLTEEEKKLVAFVEMPGTNDCFEIVRIDPGVTLVPDTDDKGDE